MAEANSTSSPVTFEYNRLLWGDLIYGTKEQLQALGVGVNVQFPTGRRSVKVIDPRGFETRIQPSTYRGEGIYSASINFPGRDFTESKWEPYSLGVERRVRTWVDEYRGTAVSLAAAGLVDADTMPGQPGMNKIRVTIAPNGLPYSSTNGHKKRQAGEMVIERISNSRFTVLVRVSNEIGEVRNEALFREINAWERRMAELPRPAQLTPQNVRGLIQEQVSIQYDKAKSDKKFQAFMSGLIR